MNVETEELREKFKIVMDENASLSSTVATLKLEIDQLSTALRKIIDLLPDEKKDEIIRFLVIQGGKK